ncbi:MAG: hypothetical protein Q8S36_08725 [Sulfuricurvum sp.]|nr:hypothetical protein [Sulfuricurvum sp.]
MEELTTVDEHINHFVDMGFKILKETENYGARTLMLRRYVMDEHSEVTIKHVGSKITVIQTVNGKIVE